MRLSFFLIVLLASCVAAAAQTVNLELVLAVDASGSVSQERFELQRHGYALAFRSSEVLEAIRSTGNAGVVVALFQWTGARLQAEVLPWTVIKDEASANQAAEAIDGGPRRLFGGGTSISGAIDHSLALFSASPFRSARRTIDVSGDGSNNNGRSAQQARDEAVSQGVVINGLPILTVEPGLDAYYRDAVIGGAGSFLIAAHSFEAFAQAIRMKLVTEISRRGSPELEPLQEAGDPAVIWKSAAR